MKKRYYVTIKLSKSIRYIPQRRYQYDDILRHIIINGGWVILLNSIYVDINRLSTSLVQYQL